MVTRLVAVVALVTSIFHLALAALPPCNETLVSAVVASVALDTQRALATCAQSLDMTPAQYVALGPARTPAHCSTLVKSRDCEPYETALHAAMKAAFQPTACTALALSDAPITYDALVQGWCSHAEALGGASSSPPTRPQSAVVNVNTPRPSSASHSTLSTLLIAASALGLGL
ncbi:Aste57867_5970 [Aphanomyces stellatus]|uniref:Aste57867_5970 protein n=1 Tax=Aphanomyces stellatus TaxID=120398 RepID=A0A485KFA8_9STRA|nr:hypothetical protein As57867_005956 [Aphanomyces stellatus]VFT82987.1 Aste57867_5970 [Aphanomyces stellatus]